MRLRFQRALLPCLLAGAGAVAGRALPPQGGEVRTFSVPDTRAAAALAERVRQNLAAGRWSEGLAELQELIEFHRDDLLGGERPQRSQQPVHAGATAWARETLLSLPAAVRELYRERYERAAQVALERARTHGDAGALAAVARRWPLTEAAELAWWTIGDLELERGHRGEARLAWARALAAELGLRAISLSADGEGAALLAEHEARRGPFPPGVRRRIELARSFSAEEENDAASRTDELRLPGPGEGALGTPSEEASTWAQPYVLPEHPWPLAPVNFHAVRSGDAVLVSTSMGLACVNAFSGTERWTSGEAPGWELLGPEQRKDFYYGLDAGGALIAPAASGAIAVAALQIPVTQHANANFNTIPILVIIPDRRLFAFDLATGRPLWSHLPPAEWDGEAGSFAERMRVAGPPVIRAGRIFVLAYRMQGRVDCHLACYELGTGELLWSTQLVSGQRELNMFNRHQKEYSAPPVRVEGDRVIALTQLGTVAAVDFFSGAIQWETIYDQNPIPSRTGHNPKEREPTWRNAAPVVAGGVVIATPIDSDDLIGIDVESGALLWSVRQRRISEQAVGRGTTDVNLLLGADEHRVYLAGKRLIAIEAPAGLRHGPPTERAWTLDDDVLRQEDAYARPVLTADRIVVPTTTQRIEVDRYQGVRLRHPIPWEDGRGGNLLLGDGMLFTLNARTLNGYFEWSFLLARAHAAREAAPGASGPAIELAALLAERGRTEREAGRTDRARDWLAEAAGVLAPFLGEDPRDAEPEVVALMHVVLRSKAQVLADLADPGAALEALRSARSLAPSREATRDCLLLESELLRGRDDPERLRALEELDFAAGDLSLRVEVVPADGDLATPEDVNARYAPPPVYAGPGAARWRLAPLLEGAPRSELAAWELPVGLWVAFERADEAAGRNDAAAELSELHRILELWMEEPLPSGSAGRIAAQRIARAAERYGPGAFEPFEERAAALLEGALAADDRAAIERVVVRFPHSAAARRANDLLLLRATEEGAVGEAARIVLGELSDPWSPGAATERELAQLLRLAAALEKGGNSTFARELVRALSIARPTFRSPLPEHAGRTLQELADEASAPISTPESPSASFDGSSIAIATYAGRHEFLGPIPAADGTAGATDVLLFARDLIEERTPSNSRVSLVAFAADQLDVAAWTEDLAGARAPAVWGGRVGFAPGLAIVANGREVVAYAREAALPGGAAMRVWTWTARDGEVESVRTSSGLALAVVRQAGSPYGLHALDTVSGAELWRADIPGSEFGYAPVCGSGKAVFLPRTIHQRALVYDLFTGRRTLEIELPSVRSEDSQGAWIEDRRIFVPWFLQSRYPDRNQVVALDLDSGAQAWRVSFQEMEGGRYNLHSIVQWDGQTFLLLRRQSGFQEEGPGGLLLDLKTAFGMYGKIRDLDLDQRILGVEPKTRVVLEEPLFFLQSSAIGEREIRVHAVQLPYGHERWVQRVPVLREELFDSSLPMPALGASTVGLVFSTNTKSAKSNYRTELYCFDRHSGEPGGSQVLEKDLGKSGEIALFALGDALLLNGRELLQVMR